MRNDVIEHIGSCIWEARRHKGYSRRVLSEKTGLSERTIEKIEKGKVTRRLKRCIPLSMLWICQQTTFSRWISIRQMQSVNRL